MTIHVFSESKAVKTAFAAIAKSKSYELVWHDRSESLPKGAVGELFVYFDVAGMEQPAIKRKVGALEKALAFQFGVIDAKHEVLDVAEVFHRSAVDYIGGKLLKGGLKTARLKRILEYKPPSAPAEGTTPDAELDGVRYSGSSWNEIREDEEYTFLMLYVGIDRVGDLRRKSSEAFLTKLRKSLLDVVQKYLASSNARLWMWKEDDGLLLLPFDGKVTPAFASIVRLMLNEVLIHAEELAGFGDFTWRIGLHLGNTVYRDARDTGSIVSEDINFVFHLGGKFLPAGSVACTASVFSLLPESMQSLFGQKGTFEAHEVYVLKRPQ
jgi:hypothetical protein